MAVSEIIFNVIVVASSVAITAIISIYNFLKKNRDNIENFQNKLHNLLLEKFAENKLYIDEDPYDSFRIELKTNKVWNIIIEVKRDNPDLKYQKKYHFTFKKYNIMINNKFFYKLSKEQRFMLENGKKIILYNWIRDHFFESIKEDVDEFLKS